MYNYADVHVYACACVHVDKFGMDLYAYNCVLVYECMYACTYTCMHVYMHAYVGKHVLKHKKLRVPWVDRYVHT